MRQPLLQLLASLAAVVVERRTMQEDIRTLVQLDDETLVQRMQRGHKDAFSVLYDRYVRLVYAMAIQMVGQADASEATQEIFMRLWRKADRFDDARGTFKSWFMMLARNYLRDELRRRYKNNHQLPLPNWSQLLEHIVDPGSDVVETALSREQNHSIKEAIATLPTEQRQVILMAYFGGYSQSTIAQTLDWPLGTVKKRIRLGLQKLRKVMIQEDDAQREETSSQKESHV